MDTLIEYSTKHSSMLHDYSIPDIDKVEDFKRIYDIARPYTMTSKLALYNLYQVSRYVAHQKIPGDFVECGVWKGGSSLLSALTFSQMKHEKVFHLFDTYTGMTEPEDVDIDIGGHSAKDYIDKYADDGQWCYASREQVEELFSSASLPSITTHFIEGDVLQTVPEFAPSEISILRLDTDWYASTQHELKHLYPLLSPGGVLIIDDYGCWNGARQAVDEYFDEHGWPLFLRVDDQVRMAIKPFAS